MCTVIRTIDGTPLKNPVGGADGGWDENPRGPIPDVDISLVRAILVTCATASAARFLAAAKITLIIK